MKAITIIEKAISSCVLLEDMTVIPLSGSSESDIMEEERLLSRSLSSSHKSLLKKWNGVNLDVIRLYGCGSVHEEFKRLSTCQTGVLAESVGNIVFGDDPSGFMYAEKSDGKILSVQTSVGEIKEIAENLDDFFERFVFGKDAKEFGGEDWVKELMDAGMFS
jgi:hypothetical protein